MVNTTQFKSGHMAGAVHCPPGCTCARHRRTPEHNAKISAGNKGRVKRPEECRNISEAKRGPLYGLNLKRLVVNIYGGSCQCCHEATFEFLSIDHIDGGGTAMRNRGAEHTGSIYRRIAKAGTTLPGYQLLCMNCNWAKGIYGTCPHTRQPAATYAPMPAVDLHAVA